MPYYLTVHHEPSTAPEVIEGRWHGLAQERRAIWMKTWFNLQDGKRFCWWDSPNRDELESIFRDHDVPWDRIVKVNLTTPCDWRWRDD
jgi:hypothetical protein